MPSLVPRHVHPLNPDIVHLHWPGDGFTRVRTLARLNRPLVWTLHDMWAFTGGCHYSGGCMRYTDACGACPQLGSTRENDLSRNVWKRKRDDWRNLKLTIVTPSRWLAECVQRSSLFRDAVVHVIPNGIDTATFRPYERALARDIFRLPQERKLILFGALEADSDARKGFHYLHAAAAQLADDPALELVMFGNRRTPDESWPLPVHAIGVLDDDRLLALLYSACDVFVAPSQEDNLPNTVLEALACGTPCVAFNIGGLPDMITHQHNGYLATPFDEADLAAGIRFVLEDADHHHALAAAARERAVEQFALDKIATRYRNLYETVLAQNNASG
jgi:glycosyltransferase involved in cell wall biosynthesis